MQIIKGKQPGPPKILLYGTEGIGKSTFGAQTPNAVFIQTEDGLGEIDCERFPLARSYADVYNYIGELYTEEHPYQTIVIDSADWLEKLLWDKTCLSRGVKSIDDIGYQKGYLFVLPLWRELLDGLDALRGQKNMMVVVLAHAKIEKFEDPLSKSYDRYAPRLHKHVMAMVSEWCSDILFAGYCYRIEKDGEGFNERNIAIPIGTDRVLRTVGGPACLAKNRHNLPEELPFPQGNAWDVLSRAMFGPNVKEIKEDGKNLV